MYEAEGLLFKTEEEAKKAKKEAEGIRYLQNQMKMDEPETILKLYHDLLAKELFDTEVGLRFLFELQEYLRGIPYIKSEEIKPIPVRTAMIRKPDETKQKDAELKKYKRSFIISLSAAIALAICVVLMFAITIITGNHQNIINYENSVIDRYESWEQELQQREKALEEREAEQKSGEVPRGETQK